MKIKSFAISCIIGLLVSPVTLAESVPDYRDGLDRSAAEREYHRLRDVVDTEWLNVEAALDASQVRLDSLLSSFNLPTVSSSLELKTLEDKIRELPPVSTKAYMDAKTNLFDFLQRHEDFYATPNQ